MVKAIQHISVFESQDLLTMGVWSMMRDANGEVDFDDEYVELPCWHIAHQGL